MAVVIVLVIWVLCGVWASNIGGKKGRSPGGCFALGFFLGFIGVIIAACLSPKPAGASQPS